MCTGGDLDVYFIKATRSSVFERWPMRRNCYKEMDLGAYG